MHLAIPAKAPILLSLLATRDSLPLYLHFFPYCGNLSYREGARCVYIYMYICSRNTRSRQAHVAYSNKYPLGPRAARCTRWIGAGVPCFD